MQMVMYRTRRKADANGAYRTRQGQQALKCSGPHSGKSPCCDRTRADRKSCLQLGGRHYNNTTMHAVVAGRGYLDVEAGVL
jgi:hypothetical protein